MSRATMEDKRTLFGLLHELDPKYVNSVAFVQIVLKFTSFYYYTRTRILDNALKYLLPTQT